MAKKTKSKKRPVFWLSGNYYECQKTFRSICTKLDNPKVEVLDCDWVSESASADARPASIGQIVRSLRSRDIFDDRSKIIKLKGLPPGYTELVDALQFVNDNQVLVIDGPIGHRAKPPAKQFVSAKNSNFYKQIKKEGFVFEFATEETPVKAANWVKEVAAEMGKKIDPEAATLLVELQGGDLDVLYGRLLILQDYAEGKVIKASDVEEVCVPLFLKSVWNLIEGVCERKGDSCVEHLQKFYEALSLETQSEFFGEVQKMLGALHHIFLFAILVKDRIVNNRVTSDALQQGTAGFAKVDIKEAIACARQSSSGRCEKEWPPYFSSGFIYQKLRDSSFESLMKWRKGILCQAFREINKIRTICRQGGSNDMSYQKLCLDSMIMSICGMISFDEAEQLRDASFSGIIE